MQHQTADGETGDTTGLDLTQEVEVWSIAVPGLDSLQQIKGGVCVLLRVSPAGSILEINSKQYNLQSWLKKDPTGTRQ
jgi:hypothetical protein